MRDRILRAVLPVVEISERRVAVPVVGSKRDGAFVTGFGFREMAHVLVHRGHAHHGGCIPRIDVQGFLEFLNREIRLCERDIQVSEGHVRARKAIVDLYGLLAICGSLLDPCRMVLRLKFQAIRLAECGVPQRESRIRIYRGVQSGYRSIEIAGLVVALHISERFEVRLVGARCDATGRSTGGLGHFDFHQASEMDDGLVLECGQVTSAIFELRRADLTEAFRIDKNHRQVYVLAFALDGSLHDHRGAELAECRCGVVDFVIADHARGNHPKRLLCGLQVRELIGHGIHQAFRNRLELGIVAGIGERQYRDMLFAAGVGESRKTFTHRRKKERHDGGRHNSKRDNPQPEGFLGCIRGPSRARSVFDILFQLTRIDRTCECRFLGWSRARRDFRKRGLQCAKNLIGAGISALGFFGERTIQDRLYRRGNYVDCRGRLVENRKGHRPRIGPHERMTAGNHLNEDDAERPDIAALIDGFSEDLLWSHVRKRSGRGNALRGAGCGYHSGEPEIDDLGYLFICNDDVRGLDVAMHDVARVSRAEPPGNLNGEVQRFADGNQTARQFLSEGFSLVVPHDDEQLVVFGFFQPVDHADIGMIQRRSGPCFAQQAFFVPGTDGKIRRQEFQRDGALELYVERFVHHTHPACTEPLGDAVVRNGLTDHTAG